jgi:hypothetical protein
MRRWAAVVIPEIVLCEGRAIIFLVTARAANRTNRSARSGLGRVLIGPVTAETSAPDRRQPSWETRTDPERLVVIGHSLRPPSDHDSGPSNVISSTCSYLPSCNASQVTEQVSAGGGSSTTVRRNRRLEMGADYAG